MTLKDLQDSVEGWSSKGHSQRFQLLGWYLHTTKGKTHFALSDLRACYQELHDPNPGSYSAYAGSLVSQKFFLKSKEGYRLSGHARHKVDTLFASTGHKIAVTSLLTSLPALIPDMAERTYLDEALTCYKNSAFRAAVVMTWNLAYFHLCEYVLLQKLVEFNARWPVTFPGHHKNGKKTVATLDDLNQDLKESQVIAICKDANIISKDVWKIMEEKLGKRNTAAHPSAIVISQLQTDAFVDDLVRNVVLKIRA